MHFPDFEEFIDSLTKEDRMYIIDELPSLQTDITSSDGLTEFISRMSAYSFGKMIRILELYHRWLAGHFQDQAKPQGKDS